MALHRRRSPTRCARASPRSSSSGRSAARSAPLPSEGLVAVTLVLTLRSRPEQRFDLSPLLPHRLAGMTAGEIGKIELQTTRMRVTVGDAFKLRMGDAAHIRIEGACDR